MAKDWTLRRDDAEFLVDLLEQSNVPKALELAEELREMFGMKRQEKTIDNWRKS